MSRPASAGALEQDAPFSDFSPGICRCGRSGLPRFSRRRCLASGAKAETLAALSTMRVARSINLEHISLIGLLRRQEYVADVAKLLSDIASRMPAPALRLKTPCSACGGNDSHRECGLPCGHKVCKGCAFRSNRCAVENCRRLRRHQYDFTEVNSSNAFTSDPRSSGAGSSNANRSDGRSSGTSHNHNASTAVWWHSRPRETAERPWTDSGIDNLENRFAARIRNKSGIATDTRYWKFQKTSQGFTCKVWVLSGNPVYQPPTDHDLAA